MEDNFTRHNQRAYFVTKLKKRHGKLPELHADEATMAPVYDRNKEVGRESF